MLVGFHAARLPVLATRGCTRGVREVAEIGRDRREIERSLEVQDLTNWDHSPDSGDTPSTWNHLEALKWPQTVPYH